MVKKCPVCDAEFYSPVNRDMKICLGDPIHFFFGYGLANGALHPVFIIERDHMKEILNRATV